MGRIVAGVIVAHAVVVLFPQAMLHTPLGTLSTGTWLGAFDRWDARYYTTIAAHGYPSHAPDVRAFFPGYPIVVRIVHDLVGGALTYSQAGCLVSFGAFVVAAGLLYRLVDRRFGSRAALVSTVLLCWFPTSLFLLAPYSEALFVLEILVVATLLDGGRWWPAALVAGYASATSPEWVALTAALVVAALVGHRGVARAVGYALAGSYGAVAFVIYLDIRFGDPFAFAHVLGDFHRVVEVPFAGVVQNVGSIHHLLATNGSTAGSFHYLTSNVVWVWLLDDLAVVAALCALVYLVTIAVRDRRGHRPPPLGGQPIGARVPIEWLVLLAGVLAIASATVIHAPSTPVSTEAQARLVSVAFPLYPALYLMVRRWQAPLVVGIGGLVAAAVLFQAMFNLGYWVT